MQRLQNRAVRITKREYDCRSVDIFNELDGNDILFYFEIHK